MSRALASRSSLAPPVEHGPDKLGTSAEIVRFPAAKMPTREAYLRAFARLVWATFPASSQWGVCERAARETRAGSPDTWERIISAKTQKPDAYLVDTVKRRALELGIAIPAELALALPARVSSPRGQLPPPVARPVAAPSFDGT